MMIELNTIYNEDCLITLNRMPNDFIDLTITSPPYNVDLGYDCYKDNIKHEEYILWLKNIFVKIWEKTKDGGRCVINIGDGKNGRVPSHSDIIQMMKGIGWIPFTTILWDKNHTQSRTAWGSFMSPSQPSFPTPFEYILVFSKNSLKLQSQGVSDLTKDEFIGWSLAMWKMTGENQAKVKHPAPFPEELALRCMKMLSYTNAIVYDPFMGSGTTAVGALRTGRSFIGSEISSEYCDNARNRIKVYTQQIKLF